MDEKIQKALTEIRTSIKGFKEITLQDEKEIKKIIYQTIKHIQELKSKS